MKTKLAACFAATIFASSFTVSTSQAYDRDPLFQCLITCNESYQLCLQHSTNPA